MFLPTRELLSVYPGFVSLYATEAIPFDEIWRDTCVMLGSPIAKGPRKREVANLLAPLETSLGSKALLEGDRFFIQMDDPCMKMERLRRQFDKARFIGLKSSAVGVTITQGPMLTQRTIATPVLMAPISRPSCSA